jgi:hypothetical protein
MSTASKLVTDAILGKDSEVVVISGTTYFIETPTIETIAKAASHLHNVEGGKTIQDILHMMESMKEACAALSVFIKGDESLTDDLAKAKPGEVVAGLEKAVSLIGIQDFRQLSILSRSVARMIAKPRPSEMTRS